MTVNPGQVSTFKPGDVIQDPRWEAELGTCEELHSAQAGENASV